MRKLQLNDDVFLLPGEWNELTTEQLLHLIKLVGKKLSAEEIKLKMLLKILKARVHSYNGADGKMLFVVKTEKKKYELSEEELYSITAIFDYLFIEENGAISINPLITKNPFPVLKVNYEILEGAGEGLQDTTYERFIFLMTWFNQMLTEPERINDFIAVLYKSDDEKVKPKHFGKLPQEVKTALTWYYLGCLAFMAEKFPITFSGTGGSSSGRSVFENQMRVVDALSGNDLTKKQIVKDSLLYDALFTLEIAAENAEKNKK